MQITNDIITFDAKDFAGLSRFAKSALTRHFGTADIFVEQFGNRLTRQVVEAKEGAERPVLAEPAIGEILRGLAAADQTKRDAVAALVEQLRVALQ